MLHSCHRVAPNYGLLVHHDTVLDDATGHLRALGQGTDRRELIGRLAPDVAAPGVGVRTPGVKPGLDTVCISFMPSKKLSAISGPLDSTT